VSTPHPARLQGPGRPGDHRSEGRQRGAFPAPRPAGRRRPGGARRTGRLPVRDRPRSPAIRRHVQRHTRPCPVDLGVPLRSVLGAAGGSRGSSEPGDRAPHPPL